MAIYDYSGNAYKTYITNVTFNIDNKMQIACDAETFNEKNRAGGSQSATIIAMAKKQAEMQISEYDIRVQQMNQLATNAMGYYETIESQDDGSIICYMHDKENLSDSKTIWKKTVDGIFDCAVVLAKTNEDLRIVGISLQVAKLNIEGNTNLIIQRGTTKIINIVIYNDDDTIYALESGDKLIFGVKKSLSATDYAIKKVSTSDSKDYNKVLPATNNSSLMSYHEQNFNIVAYSNSINTIASKSEFIRTDENHKGETYKITNRLLYSRDENVEIIESKPVVQNNIVVHDMKSVYDCSNVLAGNILIIDNNRFFAIDSNTLIKIKE